MAKTKEINSREDGVTKDMQAKHKAVGTRYHFPGLGVSVKAKSYQEALEEAKKITRKKKDEK